MPRGAPLWTLSVAFLIGLEDSITEVPMAA
jgi:hypothetical protein